MNNAELLAAMEEYKRLSNTGCTKNSPIRDEWANLRGKLVEAGAEAFVDAVDAEIMRVA